MARRLTAIVAHDEQVDPTHVAEHLPEHSDIKLVEVVGTLYPPTDAIKRSDADVLIVACAVGSDEALGLLDWWHGARPGRPSVVLCGGSNNGFVEEAFRVGADDLLVLEPGPVSEQNQQHVEFALRKAVARNAGSGELSVDLGKIVCVLGPKGGIGKTITSCNLAVALAGRSKRTALVDLDLQFGDVALSLGLTPDTTSFDLAVSGGGLDAEKLDAFLLHHPSGLRVLAAPARPDQAASVSPEFIADVFTVLREEYDFIVVDTPPSFTPEVITTIDASSYICMVGMLDALSLKNTRLGMETLDLMGYEPDRIRVVLNRANTSVGITHSDVISILGRTPDILVPSHRDIARSVNEGSPVVISQRRSEAARSFEALASLFTEAPAIVPTMPRRNRTLMRRGKT
jgi:pilus assembly protein CpaE